MEFPAPIFLRHNLNIDLKEARRNAPGTLFLDTGEKLITSSVEFKKAVKKLREALAKPKDEFIRDSVIQRFEFSIELAWKTTKRVMGSATSAPKDIVREMAQSGYINNVELWLNAIDMRNLSSHTYKEDLAEKVYSFAAIFLVELESLITKIDNK